MKKALAILMTVCLLASLFVACDNNARIDELVKASFDASESRALIVSNDPFIAFNDSSIKWQYKAVKDTDPTYNVGAAATWTDIPGTTSGLLSNTIEFSQGMWNFELRAVKKDESGNVTCVVYYGQTEEPVLLMKQSDGQPKRIVINLTAQLGEQKGYIVLSNISVKHRDALKEGESYNYDAPSKVFIDGIELDSDKYTSTTTSISTTPAGLEYPVGTHRVKVQKIGKNNEILAEDEKTFEVYAGLKTTISNWIVETTQVGQFDPVAPTGTTTVNSIPASGDVTFTVANVTPSMVKGNNTTVTVPASNFTGSEPATISVAVKQASEASVDNSFTASDGYVVAAVIDLTLSAGTTPMTEFKSPVKVVTYVAENLSGFNFSYPGETWNKKESLAAVTKAKDYYYDSDHGTLTFLTDHFSSFIVESTSKAIIGNVAYETLDEAIENVQPGETITILTSGLNLTDESCINKTIKFVGSNKDIVLNILSSENKDNVAYQNGATLEFENLTIQGQTSGNYGGLAHTTNVTYNNCIIRGKLTLYAATEEFNNCTLNNESDYSIWTWGGKEVKFTGCTFNSGGKALLLYGGSGSTVTPTTVLTVTDCVFNDNGYLDTDKAAIEIGNDYNATYTLTVNDATVNGFADGKNTGSKLWANKNSMDAAHLTVTIDGDQVSAVASIGSINYYTLEEAIAAANAVTGEESITVEIVKSGNYAPFSLTRGNVTVQAAEGINATIVVSSTKKMSLGSSKNRADNVTLKGLKFASQDGTSILYNTYTDNLTLEKCTFENSIDHISNSMALYIHYPNIEIKNSTFKNWERGYYTCGDNHAPGKMIFDNNTFDNVLVPIDGYWGRYKTENTDIQISNNTINADSWDKSYIQLWDYAQYGHYVGWNDNTATGTALNATVSGNTFIGNGVLYLTHCNWFVESDVTVENNSNMSTVYRSLVEVDDSFISNLEEIEFNSKGDPTKWGAVGHNDGSAITDWNEHPFVKKAGSKYVIYTITPGDYTLLSKEGGNTITTFAVTEQELGVTQKIYPFTFFLKIDDVVQTPDSDGCYTVQKSNLCYFGLNIRVPNDGPYNVNNGELGAYSDAELNNQITSGSYYANNPVTSSDGVLCAVSLIGMSLDEETEVGKTYYVKLSLTVEGLDSYTEVFKVKIVK